MKNNIIYYTESTNKETWMKTNSYIHYCTSYKIHIRNLADGIIYTLFIVNTPSSGFRRHLEYSERVSEQDYAELLVEINELYQLAQPLGLYMDFKDIETRFKSRNIEFKKVERESDIELPELVIESKLKKMLEIDGYIAIRICGYRICAIIRECDRYKLCIDCDDYGYGASVVYYTLEEAKEMMNTYDGQGLPQGLWFRGRGKIDGILVDEQSRKQELVDSYKEDDYEWFEEEGED